MATKGVTELASFERCRSCTAELSPGRETCPACGTPVPRSPTNTPLKPRWSTGRKISHAVIAVLLAIVANLYRPYVEPYLRLMWPPWLAPYVGEAMSRLENNRAATGLLGDSIGHGRWVRGSWPPEIWWFESAAFRLQVHGTKGAGELRAKLAKSDDDWVFSELILRVAGSDKKVNLLDLAEQPERAPISTDRRLYLVPLDDLNQEEVGLPALVGYYRNKFNLEVQILAPMEIEGRSRDRHRRQVVSEELGDQMLRRLSSLARDPKAVLIGITNEPMYFRQPGWNYAPTYWAGDKVGVVSTLPFLDDLEDPASAERFKSRVRKAVTRVAGMTVYRLPRSEDPTSVLGRYMYGARPADLMSEELDGLGTLAVIDSFMRAHWLPAFTPTIAPGMGAVDRAKADEGYPCVLIKRQRAAAATSRGWQAQSTKCQLRGWTDAVAEEIEIDLRNGAVMSRETDLFVSGAVPLALTRCFRSWDDRIRAFGYNRGMGWDMYPIGSRNPYTYVDVILCDGRAVHFERISEGTNYADALYEHRQSASAFLGARFGWTGSGWDLALPSGAHLFFPESYHGKRAADGALAARGRSLFFT